MLEDLEVLLLRAEKTMNQLKCKIAEECQAVRCGTLTVFCLSETCIVSCWWHWTISLIDEPVRVKSAVLLLIPLRLAQALEDKSKLQAKHVEHCRRTAPEDFRTRLAEVQRKEEFSSGVRPLLRNTCLFCLFRPSLSG